MILHLETSKRALLIASSEVVDRPPPSMQLPKSVRFLRSCLVSQLFKMAWLAGFMKVYFSWTFGGVHGQGHGLTSQPKQKAGPLSVPNMLI